MGRSSVRWLKTLLPSKIDLVDLYFRSLIDFEDDRHAGRRNLVKLRLDGGELPSALRQILLQNHGGVLDLVGIVLRISAQADLAFFEAVQDLRLLDGLQAVEIEGADHGTLHQVRK